MKRIIVFLLTAFSLNLPIFSDIAIEDILTSITTSKITEGQFNYEKPFINKKQNSTTITKTSGNFLLSEDLILWETLKPSKSTLVITKDAVFSINKKNEKFILLTSKSEMFKAASEAFFSLFSGKKEEIEKHFEISDFNSTDSTWEIKLKTRNEQISIHLGTLFISGEKNGELTEIKSIILNPESPVYRKYKLSNNSYRNEFSSEELLLQAK